MGGLDAQFGFGLEGVPGVPVAPSVFLPFTSESLSMSDARDESDALVSEIWTQRTGQWWPGERTVAGDVTLDVGACGLNGLWLLMFGAVQSTQVGVDRWEYRFIPGPLNGRAATVQVGRPTEGATVPVTVSGCKVTSWELAVEVDQPASLAVTLAGMGYTTSIPLAEPTYTRPELLWADSLTVTVAGVTTKVKSFTVGGDNGLDVERRPVAAEVASGIREPLESGWRRWTGTLDGLDLHESSPHWHLFNDGTEATLTAGLRSLGGSRLTVEAHVRLDAADGHVDGLGITDETVGFTCVTPSPAGVDGDPIAVTVLCAPLALPPPPVVVEEDPPPL